MFLALIINVRKFFALVYFFLQSADIFAIFIILFSHKYQKVTEEDTIVCNEKSLQSLIKGLLSTSIRIYSMSLHTSSISSDRQWRAVVDASALSMLSTELTFTGVQGYQNIISMPFSFVITTTNGVEFGTLIIAK